jgi:hypothetical protein
VAWGDRTYRKAAAAVERRVGEPPVKVAFASRPGATAAVISGELTGIGGRAPGAKIVREHGDDTRLPTSFLVAVMPTRVYVFKARTGWFGVKVKKELGVFEREGLVVDVHGKGMKRFTLHSPQAGQTMAFEMMKHRVTGELADALNG